LAATGASAAPAEVAASASPSALKPSCDAVTEYGATADDGTDDREALQKAINECEVVHVPAGRYLVSAKGSAFFDLNLPAGHSIVGAGIDTTTLLQAVAGPSVRLLQASGAGVTISDLTLDGQKAIQTVEEHRAGVFATEAPDLVLRNLKSQNSTGDGFFIFKGSNDATVENVIAVDNNRDGLVFGGGTTGGLVTGSTFERNKSEQLDSEPKVQGTVDGVTVTNSIFNGGKDFAITLSGSEEAQSTGWTLEDNEINGSVFAVWLNDSVIANNHGTNSSPEPCYKVYRRANDVTVADNKCVQTQTSLGSLAGILVQGTGALSMPKDITVESNEIEVTGNPASFGVRAEGVSSVRIIGNKLIGPGAASLGGAGIYLRSTVFGAPLKSAVIDGNEVFNWGNTAFHIAGDSTQMETVKTVIESLEFNDNVLGDTSTPPVQLRAMARDKDSVVLHQTRTRNVCIAPMLCGNVNQKPSSLEVATVSGTVGTTHTITVSGTQEEKPLNSTVALQVGPLAAEVAVVDGAGTFTVPADLPVGTYPVTATFEGSAEVISATANGTLTVTEVPTTPAPSKPTAPTTPNAPTPTGQNPTSPTGQTPTSPTAQTPASPTAPTLPATKAATTTTLKLAKTKIKVNKSSKATVAVKVGGTAVPANGKVTIKAGGKTVGTGTVKNGKAKITIKKFAKQGTYKLKAIFSGCANYSASTGKTVKLVVAE
jgi:hypothetical protein